MGQVGLLWFAKWNSVTSLGGLAQAAKKHWPPPPPVSVRSLLTVLGLPKQVYALFPAGPGPLDYGFTWRDGGRGSPIQATSWQWRLMKMTGDQSFSEIDSGTLQSPIPEPTYLGIPPLTGKLNYSTDYRLLCGSVQ